MTKTLEPIHPGEVLYEDFLVPLAVTQHHLAVSISSLAMASRSSVTRSERISMPSRRSSTPEPCRDRWISMEWSSDLCRTASVAMSIQRHAFVIVRMALRSGPTTRAVRSSADSGPAPGP